MTDMESRKEDVKKEIRSLLLSAPVGLTLKELERDYSLYIGKTLPSTEIGYPNVVDFLKDISDTVQVCYQNNTIVLKGVADTSTKHIQKLVSNQRLDTRKNWAALRNDLRPALSRSKSASRHGPRPLLPWQGSTWRRETGTRGSQMTSQAFYPNGAYMTNQVYHSRRYSGPPPLLATPALHPPKLVPFMQGNMPSVPENICRIVQEIVNLHPLGIPLTHFSTIFKKHSGFNLDEVKLGFSTLYDLLASLSELVSLKSYSGGETLVLSLKAARVIPQLHESEDSVLSMHKIQGDNEKVSDSSSVKKDNRKSATFLSVTVKKDNQQSPTPPIATGRAGTGESLSKDIKKDQKMESSLPSDQQESCNIPAEIQENLCKLIEKRPDGIFANHLMSVYKEMFRKDLPLRACGYTSVVEFCSNLPKIIQIERPDSQGNWLLLPGNRQSESGDKLTAGNSREDKAILVGATMSPQGQQASKCRASQIHVDAATREAIVQVLAVHNHQLPLARLEQTFKEYTGQDLGWRESGACELKQYIHSLSDLLYISLDESDVPLVCCRSTAGPRRFDRLQNQFQPMVINSNQTTSELPTDAVGPACYFQRLVLPDFTSTDERYLELYVSNIINPDLFWIQLRGQETTLALEDLMDEMNIVYNSKRLQKMYDMTEKLAQKGMICAAIFPEDENWYRAMISQIKDQWIEVYYVDYGNTCCVSIGNLKLLKRKFLKLPAQAVQCRLSYLKPVDEVWNIKARNRFLSLSREKPLVGFVTSTKDGVLSLCLTDTSLEEDVHINDVLISENYAVFEPDSASTEVSQHCQAPSMRILYGDDGVTRDTVVDDNSSKASRRFVRQAQITAEMTIHLINLDGELYLLSSEVSELFFDEDIISAQLAKDNIDVPKLVVTRMERGDLFQEIALYDVKHFKESTNMLSVFQLKSLAHLINLYDRRGVLSEVKETVQEILHWFNPDDPYWKGEDDLQSVAGESNGTGDSIASLDSEGPSLADLELLHTSLDMRRKRILNRMMNDNSCDIANVDELAEVEMNMKKIQFLIKKFCSSSEQLPESSPLTGHSSKVEQTPVTGVSQKSTQKVAPLMHTSQKQTPDTAESVEEAAQTSTHAHPQINSVSGVMGKQDPVIHPLHNLGAAFSLVNPLTLPTNPSGLLLPSQWPAQELSHLQQLQDLNLRLAMLGLAGAGSVNAALMTLPGAGSVNPALMTLPAVGSVNPALTTLPAVGSVNPALMTVPAAGSVNPALMTLPAAGSVNPALMTLPGAGSLNSVYMTLPGASSVNPSLITSNAGGSVLDFQCQPSIWFHQ